MVLLTVSFNQYYKIPENRAAENHQFPLPHRLSMFNTDQTQKLPLIRSRYYWLPVRHLVVEVILGQVGWLGAI
jgi:hypothetical protein